MTMLATAERLKDTPVPCPGPIPTSEAHADRCRACGKCGEISRLIGNFGDSRGDAVAALPARAIG